VALRHMHYNFARIDSTCRSRPAMAAGLTSHVWSIDEIVELLDAQEKAA
jgi:hypothetical protein